MDGFRTSSPERFGRLVLDALAGLPPGLQELLDGVAIAVDELPPEDGSTDDHGEVLLGRYEAARPTGRRSRRRAVAADLDATGPAGLAGPDRLTLHRRPIEARASSKLELATLVQEVIVFTLADHLGLDDARLDDLGWP